jgi:hypothetical protein
MVCCPGSVSSGDADLGPPVSTVTRSSPGRPLLLRSDVSWTPEGSACVPTSGCIAESSGSQSSRSPYYHPLRSVSGGYSQRAIDAYEAGLRAEARATAEEEKEYVFPQGVLDRLAVQESLSVAARRRRKRGREDETAELDDVGAVSGGWPAPHRDDDADGGGDGAGGRGSLST